MLTRRNLLASAVGLGLATATGSRAASAPASRQFPKHFLWGAATAAHQVEGNNLNSDSWLAKNVKPTIYAEPSGDACEHYHRFEEDIALLASIGFNSYRFSLEWARIEPEPGACSLAELDHHRRVLATCHEHHITPIVTFNHFTVPRWFAARGGWENPATGAVQGRLPARSLRVAGTGSADRLEIDGSGSVAVTGPRASVRAPAGSALSVVAGQRGVSGSANATYALPCGALAFRALLVEITRNSRPPIE